MQNAHLDLLAMETVVSKSNKIKAGHAGVIMQFFDISTGMDAIRCTTGTWGRLTCPNARNLIKSITYVI